MTEAEWLSSNDPARMLQVVSGGVGTLKSWRASDRKLRLFACAQCRQMWDGVACRKCEGAGKELMPWYGDSPVSSTATVVTHRTPIMNSRCPDCLGTGRVGGLTDPRSRRSVEVAERYADGKATDAELITVRQDMYSPPVLPFTSPAFHAVMDVTLPSAWVPGMLLHAKPLPPPATQAALIRCIAGNPFRPVTLPVVHRPGCDAVPEAAERAYSHCTCPCPWLTHNDGAVAKLAKAIYDSRHWDELPILADALEEAGCPSEVECPRCGGKRLLADPAKLAELLDRPMSRENAVQIIESARAGIMGCKPCDCGTGTVPNPILAHLRGPGPHARGCWCVDLLLGKS